MCACSTAKRRRKQAAMVNGRKRSRSEFKATLMAKARGHKRK